jgi:peptidoglycan LD-endopeptidase LytH
LQGLRTFATILVTALVTAALTSLFWIYAYGNAGGVGSATDNVLTETTEPAEEPELVLGPSGLAIPVAGVTAEQLMDTYEDARGSGRAHNAIDIMAPHGTPVIAAAPGTVERLFYSQGGGGITAYIRSDDQQWIYYYAHLQDYAPGLKEGQRVERGDRIGTVGSSGNASPEGPHLHFAVHQMHEGDDWHGGTPVNPYPLLAPRREGG